MSKREHYKLEDLTPSEHLGYLGNLKLDNLILFTSVLALLAVMGGLIGLVNGIIWLAAAAAIFAGVATFFMLRLTHQAQKEQRQWVAKTYGLHLDAGELLQLKEGKSIQRGSSWWVRDRSPWIHGFKLQRTEAAPTP